MTLKSFFTEFGSLLGILCGYLLYDNPKLCTQGHLSKNRQYVSEENPDLQLLVGKKLLQFLSESISLFNSQDLKEKF